MGASSFASIVDLQARPISLIGLGAEACAAGAYVIAVRRAHVRGRPWPAWRAAAFLAGLLALAGSLQSGLARYDDVFWLHVVQHEVLMMLAPALLVMGAPVVLALRVTSTRRARRLVGVLQHRGLAWMSAPATAFHLPAHYYGVMYVYLLTPAYSLSLHSPWFHEIVHAYAIACGLMFWLPVLGRYPSRWHLPYATKVRMVSAGIPAGLLLAVLLLARGPVAGTTREGSLTGAIALVVAGMVTTALALLALRASSRPARHPATAAAMPGRSALAVTRRA